MECLIGIKCKDFVIIAADCTVGRSVVSMKQDYDKTFKLNDNLLMAACGDNGDAVQFAEYIAKNIQLYRMRNGYDLSAEAAATFTRRNLADYLRSSTPYQVNLLIGGYDTIPDNKTGAKGPKLYYMDYLATMVELPFAVQGYGSLFALSVMDRYYKDDMTVDQAVELLTRCINEIRTRFIVNHSRFKVRMVDAKGIHRLPEIIPVPLRDAPLERMQLDAQGAVPQEVRVPVPMTH